MRCECGGRLKILWRKSNGLPLYSVTCDRCGKGYRNYISLKDAINAYRDYDRVSAETVFGLSDSAKGEGDNGVDGA